MTAKHEDAKLLDLAVQAGFLEQNGDLYAREAGIAVACCTKKLQKFAELVLAAAPAQPAGEDKTEAEALADVATEFAGTFNAPSAQVDAGWKDEVRELLGEAYRFNSASPRAQEKINAVLGIIDSIPVALGKAVGLFRRNNFGKASGKDAIWEQTSYKSLEEWKADKTNFAPCDWDDTPPVPLYAGTAQPAGGIYVASRASIPERSAMWRKYREAGVPITASWIDETGEGEAGDFGELWTRIQSEIMASVALVLYVEPGDFPLKGAFVEAGMALAQGKPVYIVSPGVTINEHDAKPLGSWAKHPAVRFVATVDEAFALAASGTEAS